MNNEDKVLKILRMAMDITVSGHANVFVDYSGHVEWLTVYATPVNQVFDGVTPLDRIVDLRVSLSLPGAIEMLDRMIRELSLLSLGHRDTLKTFDGHMTREQAA
jgi:hypothetical protein